MHVLKTTGIYFLNDSTSENQVKDFMDCAKECCKEESFKELFLKINSHSERIVAMEVKLQMILWGIAIVAGLVLGNIATTVATAKERVDRIYYGNGQSETMPVSKK